MKKTLFSAGLLPAMTLAGAALAADEPVKIGMITTLSGPAGYLGEDIKLGFELAMAEGMLGDVPVELVVEDDGLNPAQGRQIVDGFLYDEDIPIITGIVFSNIAGAVVPDVLDYGSFYISPNAGPSTLAGEGCNENYFVVSWQNDTLHEASGKAAQEQGYGSAFLVARNYQAGKDAITGFKRYFDGEILGELYTSLDQTDFASEIAQIRAADPDVVFQFHPGGGGIAFIRQYQQAGLTGEIPMILGEPTGDAVILNAVGDAALGLYSATHWVEDLDNPANKAFVSAWKETYGDRPITSYAAQGYDTAQAIGAALSAVDGDISDKDGFREALRQAQFDAVVGDFSFGPNQHPVTDWYLAKVVEDGEGTKLETLGTIFDEKGDAYADQCKM